MPFPHNLKGGDGLDQVDTRNLSPISESDIRVQCPRVQYSGPISESKIRVQYPIQIPESNIQVLAYLHPSSTQNAVTDAVTDHDAGEDHLGLPAAGSHVSTDSADSSAPPLPAAQRSRSPKRACPSRCRARRSAACSPT